MSRVIIIAEAGVNHNGDLNIAKRLIEIAAEAGCDYVKFQTFNAENLVSYSAQKADYQLQNSNQEESQLEMLQKLELSKDVHYELIKHCNNHRIKFFSTAFDDESLDFLKTLNLGLWKVPSGEITNLPYLMKIGSYNENIILSTGMADMEEIKSAINVLIENGTSHDKITVLHCNTEYPTPFEDVNLNAMLQIKKELGVKIGYSDHTEGIEVPIAAVALGATIIEKHFTLDKAMKGPDHRASLEPDELKSMVSAIRNIEEAMGDGIKRPSPSEIKNRIIARKSIHLKKEVIKGHFITMSDLVMKRPGDGISPMNYKSIIGKKAVVNLSEDHKLAIEDIE